MLCVRFWKYSSIILETLTLRICPKITCVHAPCIRMAKSLSNSIIDSLDQRSASRREHGLNNHAQTTLLSDLQSTLNTRKMLFPRPMGFGPHISHSLPYMSNVNDLQALLHLFW